MFMNFLLYATGWGMEWDCFGSQAPSAIIHLLLFIFIKQILALIIEPLQYTQHYSKYFTWISLFNPHNKPKKYILLLFTFYD